MPVKKEETGNTTFTSHVGNYHYIFMSFGLCNAPATFLHALEIIISEVRWKICLVYIVDVTIVFWNSRQNCKNIDDVLTLLCQAGMTSKPPKFHFAQSKTEHLGRILMPGCLAPFSKNDDSNKVAEILKLSTERKMFLVHVMRSKILSIIFLKILGYSMTIWGRTRTWTGRTLPLRLQMS